MFMAIFANTEIYVKQYKPHWKIVKTTFHKFFRCMAHLVFNCKFYKLVCLKRGEHIIRKDGTLSEKEGTLSEQRAHYLNRGHIIWKEGTLFEKRAHYLKRGHIIWKEGTLFEKRAHYLKRGHIIWKEGTLSEKRAHYLKKSKWKKRKKEIKRVNEHFHTLWFCLLFMNVRFF